MVIPMSGESGPRDNLEKVHYTTLHLYAPLLALAIQFLFRVIPLLFLDTRF
jgi:hypothetical protein